MKRWNASACQRHRSMPGGSAGVWPKRRTGKFIRLTSSALSQGRQVPSLVERQRPRPAQGRERRLMIAAGEDGLRYFQLVEVQCIEDAQVSRLLGAACAD